MEWSKSKNFKVLPKNCWEYHMGGPIIIGGAICCFQAGATNEGAAALALLDFKIFSFPFFHFVHSILWFLQTQVSDPFLHLGVICVLNVQLINNKVTQDCVLPPLFFIVTLWIFSASALIANNELYLLSQTSFLMVPVSRSSLSSKISFHF